GPPQNARRPGFATLSLCGFPEHDRGINFPNRRRIKTACKSLGLSVAKQCKRRFPGRNAELATWLPSRRTISGDEVGEKRVLVGAYGELIRHKQK
ncbi:MAG TPA: hypothetical protein VEQ86_02560, partial [Xanthobacteraceae bacterium]|nr:hypothetical protein [Xanthobacteraceae bacterium]